MPRWTRCAASCDYLRDQGLVEISDLDDGMWHARLTAAGVGVVEYTATAPAGIARPAKQGAN